jgi:hypothetical protein
VYLHVVVSSADGRAGLVQVRAVFGAGNRVVAGCMVNEGMLRKGCLLVVNRGKKVTNPDH